MNESPNNRNWVKLLNYRITNIWGNYQIIEI